MLCVQELRKKKSLQDVLENDTVFGFFCYYVVSNFECSKQKRLAKDQDL